VPDEERKKKEWIPACVGMTKKRKTEKKQQKLDRITGLTGFFSTHPAFILLSYQKKWIPACVGMTKKRKNRNKRNSKIYRERTHRTQREK